MSYMPLLEDLTTLGDELAELGDDILTGAIKAGARHSSADTQMLQEIAEAASDIVDLAVELGADDPNGGEGDVEDEDAPSLSDEALKAMYDDPAGYAQHECGDIAQACQAMQAMAMLMASELSEGHEEDEEGTIAKLAAGMRALTDFISREIDAITDSDSIKAVAKRDDVTPADKERAASEYGDVAFADEKNKKYPIDTEDHIRAAWTYINQDKNAAKYDGDEVGSIKKKIVAAWKKVIDKAGPPSAGAATKTEDDPPLEMIYGGEIKAIGDGNTVGGYAVLFGSADTPDMSQYRDYFTRSTDFWIKRFGWPRPMTYHHGMDKDTRDDPIVGEWTKARVDDVGIWLEGQLDQAHKYHGAIKELVRRGFLKLSSDSAPQWVVRERQPNGTHEVKRWPLLTASPTVTPAEPRLSGLAFKALMDELGMEEQESPSNTEVKADDADRQRAILLELALLELETGIPA